MSDVLELIRGQLLKRVRVERYLVRLERRLLLDVLIFPCALLPSIVLARPRLLVPAPLFCVLRAFAVSLSVSGFPWRLHRFRNDH